MRYYQEWVPASETEKVAEVITREVEQGGVLASVTFGARQQAAKGEGYRFPTRKEEGWLLLFSNHFPIVRTSG